MPELATDCPHCGALKTGFVLRGEVRIDTSPTTGGEYDWRTLWICNRCHEGIVVNVRLVGSSSPTSYIHHDIQRAGTITAIHPKPSAIDAPQHVPDNLSRTYVEAADNLRRENCQSAGMMFRRVLERSTLAIADGEGSISFDRTTPLRKRIRLLADHQLITPAMRDWADVIRFGGNDAAHGDDDDFDQSDAEQLKDFTELFLLYAFTMPKRVELARDTDGGPAAP